MRVHVHVCVCRLCGARYRRENGAKTLFMRAAACEFYEYRLLFFPIYEDEQELQLHHFNKSLLKKLEKDHFYRNKLEKHYTDLH